ncbi:TetR/AcrR family transcriptional regulator [Tabrizicola sp.]|jgi:AcrR family transcriptional regulator|uniref:TetR/AcrR family transcriptional regulator n=1 Tax=Tabrizicola sp. TaxID=2005166 RepID=UPI0035B252C7
MPEAPNQPPAPRARNRDETRAAILAAAQALLAEEGFSGFGVNALARRSGFDKQLIYRYFGGLDGLVDALGEALAGWVATHLAPLLARNPGPGYGDLVEAVMLAYLDALRGDSLMQKLVAWELSDPSPQVRRLSDQRARAMGELVAGLRGDRQPAPGLDAPELNAILIGAIQHLVLAGATSGRFSGLALASDADWDRAKAMLSRIVRALDGPS